MNFATTEMEHKYTSTGIKFWRHKEQMESYRAGTGRTVISTHISPEGACPIACSYCSTANREPNARIDLPVIQQYVTDLQSRGLKAVILTGGGEPTAYRHFSELVLWIHQQGLKVALITNGLLSKRVAPEAWKCFTWVRVSINVFDGWLEKIRIPTEYLSPDCVVGCSMVYTPEHRLPMLKQATIIADANKAKYIRILPNCLLAQPELMEEHKKLDADYEHLNDERFFHQHKVHEAPSCGTCHQSYFRPYLSEVVSIHSGTRGAVFPCDSVVLNGAAAHFPKLYQLCAAKDVLKYLDGEIKAPFDPRVSCSGCVFTANVNLLDDWRANGAGRFSDEPLMHEEFV